MNDKMLLEKIEELKKEHDYKELRSLIKKYEKNLTPDLLRALAECYYKDLELSKEFAYPKALKILDDITDDDNPHETLCLKGAIYKRKWEYTANQKYLIIAKDFYQEAYNLNTDNSYYSGINVAFLLDELANTIKSYDEDSSKKFTSEATDIREEIIEKFKDNEIKDKWLLHSLAQASFGLEQFNKTKEYLEASCKLDVADWQRFTTFKQIKELARLKSIDDLSSLVPLIGEENRYILEYNGFKIGLALSGGGFRASLFHLGTLAKLAQLDLLKHIEVISTVSGGTIIGTLYYLKLQKLLEEKHDKKIVQKDYIDLVEELIEEFFEVVQSDIRNSVLWYKPQKTIKFLIPFNGYSRTNKLGELYQERFYRKNTKGL